MSGLPFAPAQLAWDADGVIIDSRATAWAAMEDIAALFGPRRQIRTTSDRKMVFGREAQIAMAGSDGIPALAAIHRVLMRSRSANIPLFGETIEIVSQLIVPPQLITAAYASGIGAALGEHAALFHSIRGCEDGNKDNLIAEAAAKGLALYVCDTAVDIRRCRSSGVAVVAAAWGYDDRTDLIAAEPDLIVDTPRELEVTLGRLGFLDPRR
jgi:phosphoglycolate phosphatase-like HAD superfamily hydrolase